MIASLILSHNDEKDKKKVNRSPGPPGHMEVAMKEMEIIVASIVLMVRIRE